MNLGNSPSSLVALLSLNIFEIVGLSLVEIEKILFYFLFTFSGLSMYFLTANLIKDEKKHLAGVISAFIYMMNTFTWTIKWSSGFIVSLYAYGALPLMLGLFIKGLSEKRNKKYAFLIGLTSLLAAPSGSTPTYFIVIWFILFTYLLFHIISKKEKSEIASSLKFTALTFVTWLLFNLWWLLNTILNFSESTISQIISSESYSNVLTLNSISTNFLNIFRLLGFWAFGNNFKGDLYFPDSPLYSSFFFVLISFLLPILAFGSLLIKKAQKNIIYFSFLSIIGLFLVKGLSPPFGSIYEWLFFNLPGFSIFRSPYEKWGVLVTLSYAFTIAFTLSELYYYPKVRRTIRIVSRKSIIILCILILFVYPFPFFTGDIFPPQSKYEYLKSSRIQVPTSYSDASSWLDEKLYSYGIFSMPSNDTVPNYYSWGWSGVSGLDPIFFISKVTQTNPLFDSHNPRYQQNISKILGLFNTKYIVLHEDAYWQLYGTEPPATTKLFLENQKGISLEESFGEVDFYKISDKYFLPKIYPTDNIFLIDGGTDEMYALIASDRFQVGSVVLLSNQTNEQSNIIQNNFDPLFLKTKVNNIVVYDSSSVKFNWTILSNNGNGQNFLAVFDEGCRDVIRTDGYDNDTTLSFSSLEQCPYKFSSFNSSSWSACNSTLVYITTGDKPLTISSIYERNVKMEDISGVWWETDWMGMNTKDITFPIVIPANQRAIMQIGHKITGNITVNSIDLEGLSNFNNVGLNHNLKITFKSVNPTHYEVKIENASQPFFIVLNENYNQFWKAFSEEGQGDDFNNIIMKYGNVNEEEIQHENKISFGDLPYLFAKPMDDKNHFVANGFVNAWYVDPALFQKDGDQSFIISFYFLPQSYFYLGLIISGTTFVACIGYLIYDWKYKKERNAYRNE